MAAADYEGLSVTVTPEGTWPGIEPTDAGVVLTELALEIAGRFGDAIGSQVSGGMSDGCWIAAAGMPTLDGLGPIGGHDHSPSEYLLLDSVPQRCAMIAGLCAAVGSGAVNKASSQGVAAGG